MDKEEKSVFNPSISISFMEDLHQTLDLCKDDEQFPDYFKCSICLDLLYKPVVLGTNIIISHVFAECFIPFLLSYIRWHTREEKWKC